MLEKQNKKRTLSPAKDEINHPREMSRQVTMEPEATELKKENGCQTIVSAEVEIDQSQQIDHDDSIEPNTNKDESVAFELNVVNEIKRSQ